ncbi:Type-2 restriction enzyme EcoRV [compost metagenome]
MTNDGIVFPLGSDTKVLSTIFELFTRPIIIEIAQENGLFAVEPTVQNHYPDFTIMTGKPDQRKIAVDVKTTYVDKIGDSFGFTLGGYTSFIRGAGTKNIVFPFSEYSEHWVIGYVYKRVATKKTAESKTYRVADLADINPPYEQVQIFVQEKWRIASDKAGSGNTTNIGSINGVLPNFENGETPFRSEAEFLEYWRNYERTAGERDGKFKNINEFRNWKKSD